MIRGTLMSITLNLKNTAEMEIVQDAVALIMVRREHEADERKALWDSLPVTGSGDLPEPEVITVRDVTPAAPDAPKVTMADMEAAAQASLKARQLVGTRAIIDTIAPGKRISEIDQALWPALLEKLKVPA